MEPRRTPEAEEKDTLNTIPETYLRAQEVHEPSVHEPPEPLIEEPITVRPANNWGAGTGRPGHKLIFKKIRK